MKVSQNLSLNFWIDFHLNQLIWLLYFSFLSATFDRIAEINFNLDADDNSVSVFQSIFILC